MSRRGRSSKSTNVTIAHMEYITDILPSQDFTMQIDQAINPGLPFLFPWLSSMAKMFETYRIIKLVFFFKSTSADAVLSTVGPSGSTSLGSVIMMAQYNVLADPPLNKREMLNNSTATSCKPSNSMSFTVNPHASYKTLFVRTPYTSITSPDNYGDRRLYDHADFHLATEGMQASTGSIGELSVMAVMKFSKPTLSNQVIPVDKFYFTYPVSPTSAGVAIAMFRFNAVNVVQRLKPVTGSTIRGYLAQNPNTNNWAYFFGDCSDEQIGAIYKVDIHVKMIWDGAIGTAAVLRMDHPDFILNPDILLTTNCVKSEFLGDVGDFHSPVENTNGLTSLTIVPTPAGVTSSQGTGIQSTFYITILGRDASFEIDETVVTNIVHARFFAAATGLPLNPAGGTNFKFSKDLQITLVQAATF